MQNKGLCNFGSYRLLALAAGLWLLPACDRSVPSQAASNATASRAAAGTKSTRQSRLTVVCTIGMIADSAARVGGEHVSVTGLMGEGVDPHLYKVSPADVNALQSADLILYNGLNLEGKMSDLFVRMARKQPTVAVTESIAESRLREPKEFGGHFDPHVWFDVSLWMKTVERVRDALVELDAAHRGDFEQRASAYLAELDALHAECRRQIGTIPAESRVLITAHDAFGYFGQAYDIEVRALQGISTESEASLRHVNELVDFIVKRGVKAVFVETSVPPKTIEALVEGCKSRGHVIRVGGTLFSDAMGRAGTPEGTYVGMVRHNVKTIVEALK